MGREKNGDRPSSLTRSSKHASQKPVEAPEKASKEAKKQLPPLKFPIVSWENIYLIAFAVFCVYLNCTYQKLMSLIYSTEAWHLVDHVIRILMNLFFYHDVKRGVARNLVFNTLRCMPEEFIFYALYGTIEPRPVLLFRLASIWLVTIVVQYCCNRRAARRYPNSWICL